MMDDEGDDGADQRWLPPANNNRDRKTVNWRGNQVGEKEGIALRNLFDDLQNYFGQPQEDPKVTINIHLDRNSDDEGEIDAKADYLSVRKKGKLDFTYKISYKNRETSQKLEYMSMDICLDMTPKKKLNFGGHDMKDYCRTWAYASAPRYTIETFLRYFETGTGLNASSKGLILDENRNMVHFEAQLLTRPHPEPIFWVEDEGKEFKRVGTVHEASQDPRYQLIVRCVGIFLVTAAVARNRSGGKEEVRLSFTLVSVRTQGFVNNLAPVVYDPRHCTICNVTDDLVWWEY